MTLYETTEYYLAQGNLKIVSLGRTASTKSYATWYCELEEGLIMVMTVCKFPDSTYSNYGCIKSRLEDRYCFSVSLGENELEARFSSDIITPLKIGAKKDEKIIQTEDLLERIIKKLGWKLPADYVDYII